MRLAGQLQKTLVDLNPTLVNDLLNTQKSPFYPLLLDTPFLAHFYYSTLIIWSMMDQVKPMNQNRCTFSSFCASISSPSLTSFSLPHNMSTFLPAPIAITAGVATMMFLLLAFLAMPALRRTPAIIPSCLKPKTTSLLPAIPGIVPRLPTDIAGLTS